MRMHKKAADQWISWVLLMGFTVMLSAFMYHFMVEYTESSTDDMKKVVYNTDECRMVSLNIDSACISAQALNITLQNKNYIRIDRIDFRYYAGRNPLHTNQTNMTMNPNRVKELVVQTGAAGITRVEVIPHIIKENNDIICSDKKASADVPAC